MDSIKKEISFLKKLSVFHKNRKAKLNPLTGMIGEPILDSGTKVVSSDATQQEAFFFGKINTTYITSTQVGNKTESYKTYEETIAEIEEMGASLKYTPSTRTVLNEAPGFVDLSSRLEEAYIGWPTENIRLVNKINTDPRLGKKKAK
jgi:hypothetical protein